MRVISPDETEEEREARNLLPRLHALAKSGRIDKTDYDRLKTLLLNLA